MSSSSENIYSNKEIKSSKAINRRILVGVTVSFLFLTTYFLISDYYAAIHMAEKLTLDKLKGITNDLALRINPDQHLRVSNNYLEQDAITNNQQDADYQQLHLLLAETFESHKLGSPIYTFVKPSPSATHLEFIATSSEKPYYRHKYTSLPEEAFANLEQGGELKFYNDEFGNWLSAFSPIRTKAGEIVGYVQADEPFDHFIKDIRKQAAWNTLVSLFGFAAVIILLLPYIRQLLRQEEKHIELLKTALDKTKLLSEKLEENEQQLKENAIKLERSNKDLTDFAHIASHDLKAPIRSIHSFSQLILRRKGGSLDESTLEYLDFIINSANRAQNLINGLLAYSTADKDMGEQSSFSLCEVAEIARQNLITIIDEKNAKVEYEKMPVINANMVLITQVIQNLINNGIKYNQAAAPMIQVGAGVDPLKGTYFYVRDNGIGIPKEYQKNIFKMFTRLHSSQAYEGSGIGLAFCNRVVGTYGGTMWLESDLNEGSTFFFTLPKAMPEVAALVEAV